MVRRPPTGVARLYKQFGSAGSKLACHQINRPIHGCSQARIMAIASFNSPGNTTAAGSTPSPMRARAIANPAQGQTALGRFESLNAESQRQGTYDARATAHTAPPHTHPQAVLNVDNDIKGAFLAAWLILILVPAFWALDWLVMPEHVWTTAVIRLVCIIPALLTFPFRRKISLSSASMGQAFDMFMMALVASGITLMCWIDNRPESPYYAGLLLVLVACGQCFLWRWPAACGFAAFVIGLYACPIIFGWPTVSDIDAFVTNIVFLVSASVITYLAQASRRQSIQSLNRANELLEQSERRQRRIAGTDALTGIANRMSFDSIASQALADAATQGLDVGFILIDIDYFKRVNDQHGHPVGDLVLRLVAGRIHSIVPANLFARIGGEEFAVMQVGESGTGSIAATAERIRSGIESLEIPIESGTIRVTASLGISLVPRGNANLTSAIRCADQALYSAKDSGRNCIRTRYCT